MKFGPSNISKRPYRRLCRTSAFTLLEIVLAIIIVVGMLLVVLHYYQQAAQLRQNITLEVERITACRQLLQRMAQELQAARTHAPLHLGLSGSSNHIEFITTRLPSRQSWTSDDLGRTLLAQSDLRQVIYELAGPGDPAEATGLARSEGSVTETPPLSDEEFFDIFADEPASFDLDSTPATDSPAGSDFSLTPPTSDLVREFLTDQIRYLRFRFWDGTAWVDEWNQADLPAAVQISMGGPPLPLIAETPLTDTEEYPFEFYRRVVWLPSSTRAEDSFDIENLLESPGSPISEALP